MRRSTLLSAAALAIVAVAALVVLAGVLRSPRGPVARRAGDARPNVLLITIDTQRVDHTSAYGYARPTTPRLTALAATGALFASAYTPTPTTGPSHATLLTARYPNATGILKNGFVLRPDETTLTEVLAAAGYRTGAVVAAYVLSRRFGYGQGFEAYEDDFPKDEASYVLDRWEGIDVQSPGFDRRAQYTTGRAIRLLESFADGGRPFFLWAHYYDPHAPYDPPRTYPDLPGPGKGADELARAVAAYDNEIRFTDEEIGKLLDAHDRLFGTEDTIVVVASDHGEGLETHGWMSHGANLYQELVHAILIFRWPGRIAAGRRVAEPVGLVDVLPTMASLLALPLPPGERSGVDLGPALRDGAPPPADRPLFFQRRQYLEGDQVKLPVLGEMHGVLVGSWKYVEAESGPRELYDLATDPGEKRNLHQAEPARAAALAQTLAGWLAATPAAPAQDVDEDAAARLRALGYVQ